MHKLKEQFRKCICKYCDNNIGEKLLFPAFTNLYSQLKHEIAPKNLGVLTSEIVNDLIKRKVLIEVPKEFENLYGMYRILPHKRLIKN